MPISWDDMWLTFRRLPRPHLGSTAQETVSSATAGTSTSKSDADRKPAIEKGVAFENNVTGTNHSRKERDRQCSTYHMQVRVADLPYSLDKVTLKNLYFVALADYEGELAVGMGRAKAFKAGTNEVEVEWLQRRGWSGTAGAVGFCWAKSPMFDAYKPSGRVASNTHPMNDFLPVEVQLTEGSTHLSDKSLADKKQRFCLASSCVTTLREYCQQVRPALRNPVTQADVRSGEKGAQSESESMSGSEDESDSGTPQEPYPTPRSAQVQAEGAIAARLAHRKRRRI